MITYVETTFPLGLNYISFINTFTILLSLEIFFLMHVHILKFISSLDNNPLCKYETNYSSFHLCYVTL